MAAGTRYVISFVSSQHEIDAVSFYCIIDFDSVTRFLFLLNLVYVPTLRVFMSVASVATELAETGTKTCHVDAAGTSSYIPGVMSYKDVLEAMNVSWRDLRMHT